MTVIKVTTAVGLDQTQRNAIEKALTQKLKADTLHFEYLVDSSVLGGVKLTLGSRELDGTLQARLQQIRANLTENI